MDGIGQEFLETSILICEAGTTVEQVGRALAQIPPNKLRDWYVVVRLSGGGFAVITDRDLDEMFQREGQTDRSLALESVPGLLVPSRTVERADQGVGQAKRVMRRSPRRRLVVLEGGEPVAIMEEGEKAGGHGGFPTTLYGEEMPLYNLESGIRVRCQECGIPYDFGRVIDLATNQLICPEGHIIEE